VPFEPAIPPKGNSNTPGGFDYQPPKFTPAPEMLAVEACVPPNPVLRALRLRENNSVPSSPHGLGHAI